MPRRYVDYNWEIMPRLRPFSLTDLRRDPTLTAPRMQPINPPRVVDIQPLSFARGLCIDLPQDKKDMFFSPDRWDQWDAAALCRQCPLRTACAEEGIAEDHGVWGGMYPDQRRAVRKRRARMMKD